MAEQTELEQAIADVKRRHGRTTMTAGEIAPHLPEHLVDAFWDWACNRFMSWELGDEPCVLCEIVAEREPAVFVRQWTAAVAIVPLEPVTEGHTLVIPRRHVRDASEDPSIAGVVMECAAEIAVPPSQLVTSSGLADDLPHFGVHVIPYEPEGEELPWVPELGDCPVCFRPRVRRNRKRARVGLRTCGRPACAYEYRARQTRGNVYGYRGGGPSRTTGAGYTAVHARTRRHFRGHPCAEADKTCSGRIEVALRPSVPRSELREDPLTGSLFHPGLDPEYAYRPLCRSHHAREGALSATLRRYPALRDALIADKLRSEHGLSCELSCDACIAIRRYDEAVADLHVHIVPRQEGDGLALPWHPGKRGDLDG